MICRYCHSDLTVNLLDLGSAPPSNAFLTAAELSAPEVWLPLRLKICTRCWLAQTEDFVGREQLFSNSYAYFSSFSDTWLEHSRQYVEGILQQLGLTHESFVVEVAANDGYLLQYVKKAGIPCLGIEPTASTAGAARAKGIEIISEFFGTALARSLASAGRKADLVIANNVLAHVPDINDFVAGFRVLLKKHGVATFEFPHLLRMIDDAQFDTAYHEHYSYLSLTATKTILEANGLAMFDVERLLTHGGSLRVYAQRASTGPHRTAERVAQLLDEEEQAGIRGLTFYSDFQNRAETIKNSFLQLLLDAKNRNLAVAGYGAAAKANTLLNFAGVRQDLLPYIVDRSTAKQGKFMPGSRIPIVSENRLKENKPDLIIIFAWNVVDEIKTQIPYARDWGAKFVTLVPHRGWIDS